MIFNEILELYPLLDRPGRVAPLVASLFAKEKQQVEITQVTGNQGKTDFVKILISGKSGKSTGGKKPTLGIIGRLGGIGARPERIGFTSDGDGALTALGIALRLARMKNLGDQLEGDVIITTHLCTDAPTEPHEPVPFMGSPVDLPTMNRYEVDKDMDAIFSIDTSRGNKIINTSSFAISPTVKEGWILKVANDLLSLMEYTTGKLPFVLPISMQDITPYGNDIYHFNSIMQPACTTDSPVVGIAITSEIPVPGCATGVTNPSQLDGVGRFVIEAAVSFTNDKLQVYDKKEFKKIIQLYGSMKILQKEKK